MGTHNKLINADFKFIVESIGNNQYVCSQLPDRTINVTTHKPKTLLFSTDKFGKKVPMFNSECYTYTTTFHDSGFSFSYAMSTSLVMGESMGFPALSPIEVIQNNLPNCYLNFVNESFCKTALSFFNDKDTIIFGKNIQMVLSISHWMPVTRERCISLIFMMKNETLSIRTSIQRPINFHNCFKP